MSCRMFHQRDKRGGLYYPFYQPERSQVNGTGRSPKLAVGPICYSDGWSQYIVAMEYPGWKLPRLLLDCNPV